MRAIEKTNLKTGLSFVTNRRRPRLTNGSLLIETHLTGVCGTDLHIYFGDAYAQSEMYQPLKAGPIVIGHEAYGKVVGIGKGVSGFRIGEFISLEAHVLCEQEDCPGCKSGKGELCTNSRNLGVHRHGVFADYFVVPHTNAFKVPSFISPQTAAILDPLGNAVHAVIKAEVKGKSVIVTGGGPIGIMAALVAQAMGAKIVVVSEPSPERRNLAKKAGVIHTVDLHAMKAKALFRKLKMRSEFDAAIELAGHQNAFEDTLKVLKPGGKLVMMGLFPGSFSVNLNQLVLKQFEVIGASGRTIGVGTRRKIFSRTWRIMRRLLESGLDVSQVITGTLDPENYQEALNEMAAGRGGKFILDWRDRN